MENFHISTLTDGKLSIPAAMSKRERHRVADGQNAKRVKALYVKTN